MNGGLRGDIPECQGLIVLIDNLGRDLLGYDLVKDGGLGTRRGAANQREGTVKTWGQRVLNPIRNRNIQRANLTPRLQPELLPPSLTTLLGSGFG